MLRWDEYEFIEFFGVLPQHEEDYGISDTFCVERDGLRLLVSVFQYEKEIDITLYQSSIETPFFNTTIRNIIDLRFLKYPKGLDALEIVYSAKQYNRARDGWTENMVLHIEVLPHLNLKYFAE